MSQVALVVLVLVCFCVSKRRRRAASAVDADLAYPMLDFDAWHSTSHTAEPFPPLEDEDSEAVNDQ